MKSTPIRLLSIVGHSILLLHESLLHRPHLLRRDPKQANALIWAANELVFLILHGSPNTFLSIIFAVLCATMVIVDRAWVCIIIVGSRRIWAIELVLSLLCIEGRGSRRFIPIVLLEEFDDLIHIFNVQDDAQILNRHGHFLITFRLRSIISFHHFIFFPISNSIILFSL